MDNSGLGGGFLSSPRCGFLDLESRIQRTSLGSLGEKGKKESPWQRMKWTDNVVRLLIAVVARVGDDGTLDGVEGMKRKSGVMQKKGKWKTVSKVMISKGCYVSPQQVVEDPFLMESMPHLTAKLKEDVRKILSSKHLFYKEMCAYHNGKRIPNCDDIDLQAHSLPLSRCSKDNNGSEEEETDENGESDDDESDNEDNNNTGGNLERMEEHGEQKKQDEDDEREWITGRRLQLQEQRVGIQAEAFELEKRCFKWLRFCSKKETELERSRLENERMMLENERMALQLKQKELEIALKRPDASLEAGSLNVSRWQGKDQVDLGRRQ
ncbi:sequence-specific DNA binding transcription factor [Actinidia rufa]|uniref:Sequence-specific DNA binding transcription factor n=1 Tax=Actinidia rufa TaxID=165716 RepID=A0A7J0HC27_9ERIC|nr:sequence-specific DNA binding transcription factor [Actinidia rufa]